MGWILLLIFGPIILFFIEKTLREGDGKRYPNLARQKVQQKLIKSMKPFQARISEETQDDSTSIKVFSIKGIGLFPKPNSPLWNLQAGTEKYEIEFCTWVFQNPDIHIYLVDSRSIDILKNVYTAVEQFSEKSSGMYLHQRNSGLISTNSGFIDWAEIGVVIPEILIPPFGGKQELVAVVQILEGKLNKRLDNYNDVINNKRVLWQTRLNFSYFFPDKGYKELKEEQQKLGPLIAQLAVAVALSDGTFHETEGNIIKKWMTRKVSQEDSSEREEYKKIYNSAFRLGYKLIKEGTLTVNQIISEINEFDNESSKYEALELCYRIIGADGEGDAKEFELINKISSLLKLDNAEVERLRDLTLMNLKIDIQADVSIEEILGINTTWDNEKIKKYLIKEFSKWNNRLNSAAEGDEKEQIQQRIDMISEARKKYV